MYFGTSEEGWCFCWAVPFGGGHLEHFGAEICALLIWKTVEYSLYHARSFDIHNLAQATLCLFFVYRQLASSLLVNSIGVAPWHYPLLSRL